MRKQSKGLVRCRIADEITYIPKELFTAGQNYKSSCLPVIPKAKKKARYNKVVSMLEYALKMAIRPKPFNNDTEYIKQLKSAIKLLKEAK